MQDIMKDMLNKKNWAVIGATQNTSKFGYKIFKKLREKCFQVTPVNPVYDNIDQVPCLNDITESTGIDVVNMVVGPDKSLVALDAIKAKGIKDVWFQPGTYNDEVIKKAENLGLRVVYGYCILVELGDLPFCPL